jgi:hypothetical protein
LSSINQPMIDKLPSPVEQWTAARSLLDHYQSVINQRFTWVTAAEGFVFTAFALTVNAASGAKTENTANLLWSGAIAICIIGGVLPWLFAKPLLEYGEEMQKVRRYWENLNHEGLPPLSVEPVSVSWLRIEKLPYLVTIAWVIAIIFGLIALCMSTAPPQPRNSIKNSITSDY